MKKFVTGTVFAIAVLATLAGFSFSSCSKDGDHTVTEIPLSAKSLDSIKFYIRGNWKLIYNKGGFTGQDLNYFTDNYMSIFPNDSISWTKGSTIISRCISTLKYPNYPVLANREQEF